MLIAGVVTEYNPLHNGHLYQLDQIRHTLSPDLIIATMSGDFVQRGEPSLVSKWDRVCMALRAGVDLVIELPYIFAVGKADIFAGGAVSVLDQIGVSHLVFGSEAGRIAPFTKTLHLIESKQLEYRRELMDALKQGISYPNAHAAAYHHLAAMSQTADLVDLTQPNNILGYQYIRAIWNRGSHIEPITIQRKESGHNDSFFTENSPIASASSIRDHLLTNKEWDEAADKIPSFTRSLLKTVKEHQDFANWETFFPFLKFRLLSSTPDQLAEIYEAEEGIEHRLLACIGRAQNFHDFISAVKTKRYTWSRLQRLCVHVLTSTGKSEARGQAASGEASYLRLLGMNRKGQKYLAMKRKELQIPLISKIRQHRLPALDLDVKAATLYDYLSGRSADQTAETSHPPVRYDEEKGQFLDANQ
ncbi:nucleotidyltransferase [Sporolactobacillus pectinivorans]|uniref:nucleotidyltransferase n=1 Tax=Sporolactobacillus pectinivorans TaxID=1591408 RepID=UPI000C264C80|nr:nucleotidyltransferase [Sporolactobacillus pectinivorans]